MRNTIVSLMTAVALTACAGPKEKNVQAPQEDFNYVVDQFADFRYFGIRFRDSSLFR